MYRHKKALLYQFQIKRRVINCGEKVHSEILLEVYMKKIGGSSTRSVEDEVALHLCNATEMSIFPPRCKFNCNAIAQPCVGEVARHDV